MAELLGGRYELGEVIGSGGMGEVRAAHDTRLDRAVAVKLLRPELADGPARERFVREARAAAGFTHPSAVSVYDAGEEGTSPFIVMELVDGPTLAEVLAERGPFDEDETLEIVRPVLAALAAAHAQGMVHRDVKPANILLPATGGAKLADFGIAKALADVTGGLTTTGDLVGTPSYLSPEQVQGEPASPRSDVYAAGVVMFQALTGTPPFTGDTPIAVAVARLHAPAPSLADVRPGVTPALASAVDRALGRDPDQRPADAGAFLALLDGDSEATTRTIAAPVVAPIPVPGPANGDTIVMPTMAVTPPPPERERRNLSPALAQGAIAAVVALALIGVALAARSGRDNDGEPTAATQPVTETTAATTAPTTTAPPTTAPPPPGPESATTLEELLAIVGSNPEAYGEKGSDLSDIIGKVLSQRGPKQGEEAAKAQEEIAKWRDEGELDPAAADTAIALLGPFADQAPERRGGAPRDSNDDDDDD